MSESFYICRVRSNSNGETQFYYITEQGGWCNHFGDAKPFISMDAARATLNRRPGSIWSESDLKASPYYAAEMKLAEMKHPKILTMPDRDHLHPASGFKPEDWAKLSPEEQALAMQPAEKALVKMEPKPSKSPVAIAGTWDRCRQWLDAAKMFERGKLFSQVMVGFELMALHKANGTNPGRRTDLCDTTSSQVGKRLDWTELLQQEVALSQSTAYRYMEMAKLAAPRLKKLPELKGLDILGIPLDTLPEPVKEALEKGVRKLTDGKSQTDFFAELYKQGGKGTGREPGCDNTKKKLTLSEEVEIRKAKALQDWTDLAKQAGPYKDQFTLLTDDDVTAQIALIQQLLKPRQAWLKQPANKREPKLIEEMFSQP